MVTDHLEVGGITWRGGLLRMKGESWRSETGVASIIRNSSLGIWKRLDVSIEGYKGERMWA